MTKAKNILVLAVLATANLISALPARAQLQPVQLGDGSTISLPAGWQVVAVHPGSVDVQGPRGEALSLGNSMAVYTSLPFYNRDLTPPVASCCDAMRSAAELFPQIEYGLRKTGTPAAHVRRIIEAQETPWHRGRASYILIESELNGQTLLGFGLVADMPTGGNQFAFYISIVSAPEAVFRQEFGLLLDIWKSYSVSAGVLQGRLDQAARSMQQTWDILRGTASNQQRVANQCANGQDDYVRGVLTIQNVRSGEQRKVPNDQAESWVRSGEWKYVPACSTR